MDVNEIIAVAIYETDELNGNGGEKRPHLKDCHAGHQARIDRIANAVKNALILHGKLIA